MFFSLPYLNIWYNERADTISALENCHEQTQINLALQHLDVAQI